MHPDSTPFGYCECGCGEQTRLIAVNHARHGYIKGQPFRFLYGHNRIRPAADRFWEKVEKSIEPDGCWIWTRSKTKGGYGTFGGTTAHRFAWELQNGPAPADMDVCHNCPTGDNPACVRPSHMFLANRIINMADCANKMRSASGERHGRSKLTAAQVLEIRALFASGSTGRQALSDRFGVHRSHINSILNGTKWR